MSQESSETSEAEETEEAGETLPPSARRLYANRTLNLRAIKAIGFDMDYTLVHYHPVEWEREAYEHIKEGLPEAWLKSGGVEGLSFDPDLVTFGLSIDLSRGNLVKADRFGFVKMAQHGTRMLPYSERKAAYHREQVDLAEDRFRFLNTLFSLSEACMYAQLVDLLDQGLLDQGKSEGAIGYADLYETVRSSLDQAHVIGTLKAKILADPGRFIVPDPELPLALWDLARAGKKLLLITNSDWSYADAILRHAVDPHLPSLPGFQGESWRDLFDLSIISARKPEFFTQRGPLFEVIDKEGKLLPAYAIKMDAGPMGRRVYCGGSAELVEQALGLSGEDLLYFGDHVYSDVRLSKRLSRWRTALVIRALEAELCALAETVEEQRQISLKMAVKEGLEHRLAQLRLSAIRDAARDAASDGEGQSEAISALYEELQALDEEIGPLAQALSDRPHPRWGSILRTGKDKSLLARQIERDADIYTSRVSNLLYATPFAYVRAPRIPMPHDPWHLP